MNTKFNLSGHQPLLEKPGDLSPCAPERRMHLLPADLLPVLLVAPYSSEGIEVLVEVQDVSGAHNDSLLDHRHLHVRGRRSKILTS